MDSCLNHLTNADTAIVGIVMLGCVALGYVLHGAGVAVKGVIQVLRGK